jgi:hypothetical protein
VAVVAASPVDVVRSRAFRIEQRCGDAVVVIHEGSDLAACCAELGRLAEQLGGLGATGVLQLVDRATGDLIDSRVLLGSVDWIAVDAAGAFAIRPPFGQMAGEGLTGSASPA